MSWNIEALTFDVFGTVVDWRSAVIREGQALRNDLDWPSIADQWRRLYRPTIDSVTRGERAWATFDQLQRWMLDRVLEEHGGTTITEEQRDRLSTVWRRMDPWPDAVPGLSQLKEHFVICALSNGSVWQLVQLARHGRLPWDVVLSVEFFHAYKPDPRVYLGATELLQLEPSQVMMVAAHVYDLRAAKANGMRTAFVSRHDEWGPGSGAEELEPGEFDLESSDFEELALKLRT